MKLKAYITHKDAEKYSDCADYFGICRQQKKVAVSDGVSQSIMPLEWAKILVNAFLDNSWEPEQSVSSLQKKWLEEALSYLKDQRSQGKNPWMLENCITNRDGAGATFCGIVFDDNYSWTAKILGDSCLVLLNENNEITDIISSKEGEFDNRPDYFDSFKEQRGVVKSVKGELKSSQKILLVSDPFSELFQNFKNSSEEKIIIQNILSLKNYDDYLRLVDDYRKLYHMHNDDSTLVVIEYDGNVEFIIEEGLSLETHQEQELKAEQEEEAKKKLEQKVEEELWRKAKDVNTKDSYNDYLEKSKLKIFKKQAETSISVLITEEEEQKEWDKAKDADSISSYKQYLSVFPNGLHCQEAVNRIEIIKNRSSESVHGNGKEEQPEPSSEDSDRCRQPNILANNQTLSEGRLEKNDSGNKAEATSSSEATSTKQTISAETASAEPTGSTEAAGTKQTNSADATGTEPASSAEATVIEPANTAEATGTERTSSTEATCTKQTISAETTSAEPTGSAEAAGTKQTNSADATGTKPASSTEAACTKQTISAETASAEPTGSAEAARTCNQGHTEKVENKVVVNEPDEIVIPSSVNSSDGIDRKEFQELLPTAYALFKKHSTAFHNAFLAPRKWRDTPQECFRKFWFELEEIIFNSHG